MMQKLTYINLLNEQVVLMYEPYVLCNVSGLSTTGLSIATTKGAYQQGQSTRSLRRDARHVEVTLHIRGQTRDGLYLLRQRLAGVLSPEKAYGEGSGFEPEKRARLIYENDMGRWWTYAVPEEGPSDGKRVDNWLTNVKLGFVCDSPYWYAPTENEAVFDPPVDDAGFALPFAFPITFAMRDYAKEVRNAGHVAAPVEIWVDCMGETPSLINQTTGKQLRMSSPVPSGSTLYLNTDPAALAATVTDPNGAVQSAFGRLSVDTPLADFVLRPGVNRLVYEPGGTGANSAIRVRWLDAFEGV